MFVPIASVDDVDLNCDDGRIAVSNSKSCLLYIYRL
jgi:hypothetical protein